MRSLRRAARRAVFHTIARRRDTRPVRLVAGLAAAYVRAFENDDGNFATDGEAQLLDRLKGIDPTVVFDVGAHHGGWTLAALERFPRARCHAFEPAPPTLAVLRDAVPADRVVVHPCALSDRTGLADLSFHPELTEMSSLSSANRGEAGHTTFSVEVSTGDEVMEEAGLERVDVLKVDAEGRDLQVLLGFGRAIGDGRVRVVQFEYSMWNAVERVWLGDLIEALPGYVIGRIFPSRIEAVTYGPSLENPTYRANYVAVLADDADARLAVFG